MKKQLIRSLVAFLIVSAFAAAGRLGFAFGSKEAHAAPKPGLWIEQTTIADGVRVRRIHDTFDGVLCYVATPEFGNQAPSIACVLDRSRP